MTHPLFNRSQTLALASLLLSAACSTPVPVDGGNTTDTPNATDTGVNNPVDVPSAIPDSGVNNPVDVPSTPGDAAFTPSAGALFFCDMGYANLCRYGGMNRYPDRDTCLRAYDGYSMSRKTCVANALGNMMCDAATGLAPCN